MEKVCTKCGELKDTYMFYKQRRGKYGVRSICKSCGNKMQKEWRNPLSEERLFELKKYQKEWAQNNRDKTRNNFKKWRDNNTELHKEKNRIFSREHKNENAIRVNNKRAKDPIFKLGMNIRCLIRNSFKRVNNVTARKAQRTEQILGCSVEYFMEYLQSKFLEGMSFENHGVYGWHIDHIKPLATAKTEQDIYTLNHYSNFQPLWAQDNLKKKDKFANNTVTIVTV